MSQVLSNGTTTYLYGFERIAQTGASSEQYFLGDALGSVRQLVDANGAIELVKSYQPYGVTLNSAGNGASNYGFDGEWASSYSPMIYLRSRWYLAQTARFLTQDKWQGDYARPISYNPWLYAYANPVNRTDPSGNCPIGDDGKCIPGWWCDLLPRGAREQCWKRYGCDYRTPRPKNNYLNKNNAEDYGEWFHYLLETTNGWWNNNGESSIEWQQVIAIALGIELGAEASNDLLTEATAEAFGRKAWGEGFYREIGGRQSVQNRVNIGLYNDAKGGSFNPDLYRDNFATQINIDDRDYHLQPGGVAYNKAGFILTRGDWRYIANNKPYEFVNIEDTNPEPFKDWVRNVAPTYNTPSQGGAGGGYYSGNDGIWYVKRPNLDIHTPYVLTLGQQNSLCRNKSGRTMNCTEITENNWNEPAYVNNN